MKTLTETTNANEILQQLFIERKQRNSTYSTRAFARDIGISQAYVSLLLNGKKPMTVKQATRIAALLNLSQEKSELLLNSVLSRETTRAKKSLRLSWSKNENQSWFSDFSLDQFTLISRWYHLPILDLTTTSNFKEDASWIARRLSISMVEARDALNRLIRLKFLERTNGKLTKATRHFYVDTKNSEAAVRTFHKEMIGKAISKLDETHPDDFKTRSITGLTMAVNPQKIQEAKAKIKKFQEEFVEFVTEGDCTEVYQLNVQFFSLTKERVGDK